MTDSLVATRDHLQYRLDNSPGWPDDATLLRVSYDGGPEHRLTCGQAREALAEIERFRNASDDAVAAFAAAGILTPEDGYAGNGSHLLGANIRSLTRQLAAERDAKEAAENTSHARLANVAAYAMAVQEYITAYHVRRSYDPASDSQIFDQRIVERLRTAHRALWSLAKDNQAQLFIDKMKLLERQLASMTAERDALLAKQAPAGVPVSREALSQKMYDAAKPWGELYGWTNQEPWLVASDMAIAAYEAAKSRQPSAPATGVAQQGGEGHELPFVHFLKLCLSRAATAGSTVRWPDDYPLLSQRFNDVEAVLTVGGARQAVQQIETMQERAEKSEAELARLNDALSRESNDIEQLLGNALDYPECYPDISDVDDGHVCVGEHVPATIAAEAAAKIMSLKAELARIREALAMNGDSGAWLESLGWTHKDGTRWWSKGGVQLFREEAMLVEVAAIVGEGRGVNA